MKLQDLLAIVENEPVFDTGLLLAGEAEARQVRKQLSRWVASGKVYQLRRGLYALAPPYQKVTPHPFLLANRLVPGSYVSLQSALAHAGLIPEAVPTVTSVTTGRTESLTTPLGTCAYRHIQVEWLHGYERLDLGAQQAAFVAAPEKALLDLVYLEPDAETPEYLRALRLQGLDRLNFAQLNRLAERAGKPKLRRAVGNLQRLLAEDREYVLL